VFAAARELNYKPNPFATGAAHEADSSGSDEAMEMGSGSRALVFVGAEDFLRAVHHSAAGLRVPGDVSVVEQTGSRAGVEISA